MTTAADDRLLILNDSDAVCDMCGRDPKETPDAFLAMDGGWLTMIDDTGPDDIAHVMCPACAAGGFESEA